MRASLNTSPLHQPGNSRRGISLLEVLVSIAVISLGIFGVAALIPVAQFRMEQGITADRQASAGQRAAAEFRIRNMGSPGWIDPVSGSMENLHWRPLQMAQIGELFVNGQIRRRGYCLDPLGVADILSNVPTGQQAALRNFPANAFPYMAMPRVTLTTGTFQSNGAPTPLSSAIANDIFLLPDDVVFQRPDRDELPPNRQFFLGTDGRPMKTFAEGSMSWMATIVPSTVASTPATDQFLLSLVVFKNRLPNALTAGTEEGLAVAASPFSGEVVLDDSSLPTVAGQIRVADLRAGDWLLLTKRLTGASAAYRWTKILNADDLDGQLNAPRTFAVANDDFLDPNSTQSHAVFLRGVVAVYERTVRLENSTLWD